MTDPKTTSPADPVSRTNPTFEKRVVAELTEVIQRLCQGVPELRTVGIVFDWHEKLNGVALPFLFMDERGPIQPGNLSGLIGGLLQTPKLLEFQYGLAFKNCAYLAEQLRSLHSEASKEAEKTAHDSTGPGGGAESERHRAGTAEGSPVDEAADKSTDD